MKIKDISGNTDMIEDIHAEDGYTCVHLATMASDERGLLFSETIRGWLEILPADRFVQIDRGRVVNMDYAVFRNSSIIFNNGVRIKVSRRRKSNVRRAFEKRRIEKVCSAD